ncbi:MAG: hypothetical protein ACI9TI_002275 [Natronomonas sp.]|jgi:hypothetical protein
METYVLWFAKLGRFYQISTVLALVVGMSAVATGVGTENSVFLGVGVMWLLGGTGVVALASRYGEEQTADE